MAALYLSEEDVQALISPAIAIEAIAGSLARTGQVAVDETTRVSVELPDGLLWTGASVDVELGVAGVEGSVATTSSRPSVLVVVSAEHGALQAVIEAVALTRLRAAAVAVLAARHLAPTGASTLGVIGCGRLAAAMVACLREGLPGLERVVASGPQPGRLATFCAAEDCMPAGSNREAAEQGIVVTATGSRDPVLRGEWLCEGTLLIAAGTDDPRDRELDSAAIERASFICCDRVQRRQADAGDLIEPVAQGVLDWLEVHELADVVCGALPGRIGASDIVIVKLGASGLLDLALGACALERARELQVGRSL